MVSSERNFPFQVLQSEKLLQVGTENIDRAFALGDGLQAVLDPTETGLRRNAQNHRYFFDRIAHMLVDFLRVYLGHRV